MPRRRIRTTAQGYETILIGRITQVELAEALAPQWGILKCRQGKLPTPVAQRQ